MADVAKRDQNNVPTLLAVSSSDGTPVIVYADPTTHRLLVSSSGGAIGGTITGGTTGSVLFINPTATLAQDNANLFFDDTLNRLGLGINTALGARLDIKNDNLQWGQIIRGGSSFGPGIQLIDVAGTPNNWLISSGMASATDGVFSIRDVRQSLNRLSIDTSGNVSIIGGGLILPKTITPAGTTGTRTINNSTGSVNFAIAATSLVVTNSLVTVNSIIITTVATNDGTMQSVQAVAAAGSFTLFPNNPPSAETRVNFLVTN